MVASWGYNGWAKVQWQVFQARHASAGQQRPFSGALMPAPRPFTLPRPGSCPCAWTYSTGTCSSAAWFVPRRRAPNLLKAAIGWAAWSAGG